MKIVVYDDEAGRPAVGVRLDDGVLPTGHADLAALIEAGPRELDRLRQSSESPSHIVHPRRFRAPISPTSTLLLAGGNYADHLAETGLHPTEPVFFSKLRSAVIGPDDPIRIPTPETHTDWEAELCVIISKPAYRVPAERAHEYIFGYTMINDVSARDVMEREPLQITLCKCPDTFCPLGPHILTADEVPDVNTTPLEISTRVNGVYKQRTTTDTMIYSIPTLLEFLTRTVTLAPGDLMSSGTAGGTGVGRTPQEFLHPGDTITVGVTGIGDLSNPVVAGWPEHRAGPTTDSPR
ncbi:fumarylacetoacetate hydrolase family protein [Mycobacterium sp.]|uniref:fumarylacetoacetate hydrolase family protein n=1 Tax=Mycobacterium sp. TaxID=1785 RepID=UPI002D48EB11|nr:fumarylacetoacetate hydrolase family protein [Mycobacterium sp.]HZA08906.1 fumarylacetoacetate hydrolase family protein [Mycobacterium sp.]